ncbi:MAG TPA: 30S ribosomal protein S16 [Aggregatilineales bacterium]|nr:30S ribosomal protein S16 [Aggregatilineales bacterium]
MLRIRLTRVGLKKQPSYRIVIIDQKQARNSRYLESVGFYNPRTQPATITVKEDRALYWMNVGAQPSDSVKQLFTTHGTMDRFARLRTGAAMESLVAEAQAQVEAAGAISPRTRYPAPASSKKVVDDDVTAAEESFEAGAEVETPAAEESVESEEAGAASEDAEVTE